MSKGQKAVRACTIRRLNLGHSKYEKAVKKAILETKEEIIK